MPSKIVRKQIKLPKLHPKQLEIAIDPHRFKVVTCGRRFGKTLVVMTIALKEALEGGRVFWVAPTYAVAGIAWREIKGMIQQLPVQYEIHEAERRCDFNESGGWISFRSGDSGDNLRGNKLTMAVFDEAAFCKESVWTEAIRPSLADSKGKAIFISTPAGDSDWFAKLWKLGQQDHHEWKSWRFSSYDNPFLDPKEIDSAKENMSSIVFRREFMAEFVGRADSRVKRDWLKYYDKLPADLEIAMGCDLAISTKASADYTAVSVLGRAKDGTVYVIDSQRIKGSFRESQQFIIQMAEKYRPKVVGVESVAFQRAMVEELQSKSFINIKALKTTIDKITRFAPLESRIEHGQVVFNRELNTWFEDELLEFPSGEHDDAVDSLSLAWEAMGSVAKKLVVAPSFNTRNDTHWRR